MRIWSTEQWSPVPGFSSYEVSNHGRVRSIDRTITDTLGRRYDSPGVVLKQTPTGDGYLRVTLHGADRYYEALMACAA